MWWLRRSISTISASAWRSARAAASPAKPPPTITTRLRSRPGVSTTVASPVRKLVGIAFSRGILAFDGMPTDFLTKLVSAVIVRLLNRRRFVLVKAFAGCSSQLALVDVVLFDVTGVGLALLIARRSDVVHGVEPDD